MVQSPTRRPQRDRTESAQSSRANSASGGGRKPRKPKNKEKKDKPADSSVPGSKDTQQSAEAGPSTPPAPAPPVADAHSSTFGEEDFIAFSWTEDEKEDVVEEVIEIEAQVREWDKGKGKARDDGSGRKRRHEEVDLNDGYGNKKQRVDAASRKAPWAANVDWERCNNVAEMLHREVEAFVTYISPTPVEDEIRSLIVMAVSNAVTKAFPDAKVMPFGSYETKLYLPLGDIDLVIESQSMAYNNKTHVLQSLAQCVKKAGITDKVTIIAKAKVPIVKFVTRHGRFSVDISINQINGVKAGQMVKRFLDDLPALRALVLITKSFLSQRSMNEVFTGGLGSYSIVCLAISFLQMHPKIRRGEIDPSHNLGVLVMEFFELYGCYFNYNDVGISVRDGRSYYNKSQRGWSDYKSPGLLSIEDPGDPSNDISRGSYNIFKVRTTLAGAHVIMTAAAYTHASYITARRERRYVQLRDRINPEDMSILAGVMGVTQETINHRKLVQELYDKRVLHRILGVEPRSAPAVPTLDAHSPKNNGRSERRAANEDVHSAQEPTDFEHDVADRPRAGEDEEESRYGIDRRQPPKKRRSMGTEMDVHTVYTTDEDDEDDDEHAGGDVVVHTIHDSDSDTEREEGEYDSGISPTKTERAERTRSYWLSKGMSMHDDEN